MKIVALDTSTDWLSVAAFDGSIVTSMRERAGTASSERVLPAVAAVLADAGWTLAQLDGIAYAAGPGSFTGVRIACGVAQGLAFGAGLPVIAVPTLGAIAHTAWRLHGANRVFACLDARMQEVYVASYERHGVAWTLVDGPNVLMPGEVSVPVGAWHGAGTGFAAYPDLAARLCLVDADPAITPDAQSVAEWAWPQFVAGEGQPAALAQPLYVRHRVALTSAERASGLRL